jgi:hypothetical protein
MNKLMVSVMVTAIIVGGGSFYGGMKYAESTATQRISQQRTQFAGSGALSRTGNAGNRSAGGFMSGNIIAKDDKSVTIKMQDGGSKIAFISTSTQVMKFDAGSLNDVNVGIQVTVTGSSNADGSMIAQSIQIRPSPPAK